MDQLEQTEFDLLVVGGGIYGACVAWDAALRGLSVALVEQEDFGHATSANSLKTLHGGLRYLQEGNLPLVRTMLREQRAWLRIAPHLIRPLPFLLPTGRSFARSKPVLAMALAVLRLTGLGRNRGVVPALRMPHSRLLSQKECLRRLPGLPADQIVGAMLWYDAQVVHTERLLLAILQAAAAEGAVLANYARVTGLLQQGGRVCGTHVQNGPANRLLEVRAKVVVNCAGAWADELLAGLAGRQPRPLFNPSIAINLVIRQLWPDQAVGLPSSYLGRDQNDRPVVGSRILFVVPWGSFSLAGTLHWPYSGHGAPRLQVDESIVQHFVDELNHAYPPANLRREDVYHVQAGFLPCQPGGSPPGAVRLLRESRIHDHAREDGLGGLITVIGVKYTTARRVAEQVVNLAIRQLGRPARPCRTAITSLSPGEEPTAGETALEAVPPALQAKLRRAYGQAYPALLTVLAEEPAWREPLTPDGEVLKGQVIYATRHEMALTLADVVRRRTELGAAGLPEPAVLRACATLMASQLGWDAARQAREIAAVRAGFPGGAYTTRAADAPRPGSPDAEWGRFVTNQVTGDRR